MLSKALEANARLLFSQRRFFLALGLYLIVLLALRIWLFPGASEDDAEQLFYAQTWAWGYKPNQPPLYTWLTLLSQQLFGVTIAAVEAVKFAALFLMYVFLHRTAATVLDDERLAGLAAFSAVGFYYIGWDMVMNYSHTVLLGTSIAAVLWAVLRIRSPHDTPGYLVLGVAVGAGLLSKYNFGLFLPALLAASLVHPPTRAVVASPRIALSLAVALGIAAPHLYWFMSDSSGLAEARVSAGSSASRGSLANAGPGLAAVAEGALAFLSPALVVIAAFFWRAFRRLPESAGRAAALCRFFEVYFVSVLGLMAALVLVLGLDSIYTHWMMVLLPFPIYCFLRIRESRPSERRLQAYGAVFSVLAVAVVFAVVTRYATGPMSCRKCNFFVPYERLAAGLKADGADGGTIVVFDYPNQLGGNLIRYLPETRFISTRHRHYKPPPKTADGPCLVLWNTSFGITQDTWGDISLKGRRVLGYEIPENPDIRFVSGRIARSGGRMVRLAYYEIETAKGECH